jgi:hypothetical protein
MANSHTAICDHVNGLRGLIRKIDKLIAIKVIELVPLSHRLVFMGA